MGLSQLTHSTGNHKTNKILRDRHWKQASKMENKFVNEWDSRWWESCQRRRFNRKINLTINKKRMNNRALMNKNKSNSKLKLLSLSLRLNAIELWRQNNHVIITQRLYIFLYSFFLLLLHVSNLVLELFIFFVFINNFY